MNGPETTTLPMTALWRRHAQQRPDAPAVTVDDDAPVTWRQLHERTNQGARVLAALGARRGDYVVIAVPNSVDFVEALLAVLKVGAVPVPVSADATTAEMRSVIGLTAPAVVIGREAAGLRPIRPMTIASLNPLLNEQSTNDLDDVIAPSYKAPMSGGSTGRAKIIRSGLPAEVTVIDGVPLMALTPAGMTMVMPGPLYHNLTMMGTLNGLTVGNHVLLQRTFDPEITIRQVDRHRAAMALVVPTHMGRILQLPEATRAAYDLTSLTFLVHTGGPCPSRIKQGWIDWIGADHVYELYSATEAPAATLASGRDWLERPGTVGKPVMGEIKILDDDGNPCAASEVGQVWMRRPAGAARTYSYIGASSNETDAGWDTMGDLGSIDADGYLYLADRRTDLILAGGANIYPAEVEDALMHIPGIAEAVVVGVPDPDLGQHVHALVYRSDNALTVDMIRARLTDHLVRYKTPRTYELVDHPLRNDAGKIRRQALSTQRAHRS